MAIERVDVTAYRFPTDGPDGREADGTLVWDSTTMVLVEVRAGGCTGLGYTYADVSAARFVTSQLAPTLAGKDPRLVPSIWRDMMSHIRNAGRPGVGAMAVSAVDVALHDLAAKLVGEPLFRALGAFHDRVPVYGSGGFCNYPTARLVEQVEGWRDAGMPRVKIKTSRHPEEDPARLRAVRGALGDAVDLMCDANGALSRKQAAYWAQRFRAEWHVAWFEEPVPSADRDGLRLLRDTGPAGLDIAAGEYGAVLGDFRDLLEAGAVDCLQADVTRCGGITGLVQVAGLAAAHGIELSAHCAPAISAHAFCAVERLRHLEYFHDHVRIERRCFDGVPTPADGALAPDASRPGHGLELKRRDVESRLVFREEGQR